MPQTAPVDGYPLKNELNLTEPLHIGEAHLCSLSMAIFRVPLCNNRVEFFESHRRSFQQVSYGSPKFGSHLTSFSGFAKVGRRKTRSIGLGRVR